MPEAQQDESISKIQEILTSDENLIFSVRQLTITGLKRITLALTNKRFIIYYPGLFRCKFDNFLWHNLSNISLNEGVMGATLIFDVAGQKISIDMLPEQEARKAYSLAQEKGHEAAETKRQCKMRDDPGNIEYMVIKTTETVASQPKTADDLIVRLTKLKSLFDAELITQDEYEKKKAEILAFM